MNESPKICNICKRNLVWHEGVFSGWVHSHNFRENKVLFQACDDIAKSKTASVSEEIESEVAT